MAVVPVVLGAAVVLGSRRLLARAKG